MPRLIYWFAALSNAERPIPWNRERLPENALAKGLDTEGFWYLWKEMVERKILDEVIIIIESARGTGIRKWSDNFSVQVVPHISYAEKILRPDDIMFIRNGFRSWFYPLQRMNESKKWVLFYRAASNRAKWGFWDIVFEDLTDKSYVFENRLHYKFNKPIHPEVFKFRDRTIRDIDVMFHASHIHDKKGQWKCVDAAIAYKEMYGKNFIGVMPGKFYGGEKTREAYKKIKDHKLPIWVPGMVPRDDLNRWMSRCKLYMHLGGAGQNDRGNLESMLCGCQQVVGNPEYHPPFVSNNPEISIIIKDHEPKAIAKIIHDLLEIWKLSIPEKVSQYYHEKNSVEMAVDQVKKVVDFIKSHPVPDRHTAIKELG